MNDEYIEKSLALEERRLDAADEDRKIKRAAELAKVPGISVAEIREAWGLEPLEDDQIANLRLNLPWDGGS